MDTRTGEWWRTDAAIALAAAVVIVMAGAALMFGFARWDVGADQEVRNDCRDAVTARLRAPATADFGGEAMTSDGSHYKVTGHVDAQNGFGAGVRTTYDCRAERQDGATTIVSVRLD